MGEVMDDLTATRLCAEAMGLTVNPVALHGHVLGYSLPMRPTGFSDAYDPLDNDAQCMALVKKFTLSIDSEIADGNGYGVSYSAPGFYVAHTDLNHAVVYCVAAMQAAKGEA
jgi:hypothetical protein